MNLYAALALTREKIIRYIKKKPLKKKKKEGQKGGLDENLEFSKGGGSIEKYHGICFAGLNMCWLKTNLQCFIMVL